MKKVFLRFYELNSLATTFLSLIIFLLFVNLFFKIYQYSLGEVYVGQIVGNESFEVVKRSVGRFSSNRSYISHVFPQKIKFTDKNNRTCFYSEVSWNDEVKYELNQKVNVLKTNKGRIYILTLWSFWLNTTNMIFIFGVSIFITILIEIIKDNIKG
ncbi:MAG: hypothetical protein L6Q46_10760 [Flavobacterium sp.]|jgi:hypothetical protein|uniref:hypothetical protein n=1 Tax=Flavobacterium sp. TaxID=239 RepID=UPI0025C4557A|nr:hypothetical protein [Flavobacterium sp.]MCK6608761.1 hypothetical protein [Flavobacterium sp.]